MTYASSFFFCGVVFVGCNKGNNPTEPGSSSWTRCQGIDGYSVTSFATSGNNIIAGAYQGLSSYAYIFLSTDNGLTWKLDTAIYIHNTFLDGPHPLPLILIPHVTLFANGTSLFAAIGGIFSGGVYFSSDHGVTWSEEDTNFVKNVNCFTAMGQTIFAGSGEIFRSTNNGTSWSATNTEPLNGVSGLAVVGSDIFACTEGSGIYRSNDGGTNWNAVNTALFDFHSLITIGTDVFAGFPGGYSNGGVLKSTDNGTSWSTVDVGLKDSSVDVLYASGSNLFAGTNEDVFLSTNSGGAWMDISAGTPLDSLGVGALTVYDSYLLVATSAGVWRTYFH